jgi:hypothetical protein
MYIWADMGHAHDKRRNRERRKILPFFFVLCISEETAVGFIIY